MKQRGIADISIKEVEKILKNSFNQTEGRKRLERKS